MGFSSFKSYGSKFSKSKITGLTKYQQLIINKKPWGRYGAESWSENTLNEIGGDTSKNASTLGVINGTSVGNGATSPIAFLNGSTSSSVTFPSNSIPSNFTICSLTRYTGTTNNTCILSSSSNWFHGHFDNRKGLCYYGGWNNNNTASGNQDDWIVCCGTNSTLINTPYNILNNGVPMGQSIGGVSGNQLRINNARYANGNFGFSQLLIFDQLLTADEMVIVSDALKNYLATGILDTPAS
jgi:hypothetical protein